jgi:hypothetical protein
MGRPKKATSNSAVVREFLGGLRLWGVYVGKCHVGRFLAVSRDHALRIARASDLGIDEELKPRLRAKLERRA